MKKILFISIIFLSASIMAFSQEEKQLKHYIGAAAGFSTGAGLSYRYWPGNWGTQLVFTPLWNPNGGTAFIVGSGAFRTLHETQYTRLFLFLAGNVNYEKSSYTEYYDYASETPVKLETPITTVSENLGGAIGIGPGLEIYLFKNIVLDIMFGFRYGISNGYDSGLGFTGEAALYYRF